MDGMDEMDEMDEMDGIGGTAAMISCSDEAPARGMSRLEYPPHINIDAAEELDRRWRCGDEMNHDSR